MVDSKKPDAPQPFPDEVKRADRQRSQQENDQIKESESRAATVKAGLVDKPHALSR